MPASTRRHVLRAAAAAREKKAADVVVLDLAAQTSFTDAFLICTGFSAPQVQAISDAVEEALDRSGVRLHHREGYDAAQWVLLDYGGFVVHVFHERARLFYDLERLWRDAPRTPVPDQTPAEAGQP